MPSIEIERSHGVQSWSPSERDTALVEALREHRNRLGDAFPRIALFLFDCPDAEALELVLNPALNPHRLDTLNVSMHSPLMLALEHASYSFRKKLSHSADSQDQRHPGSSLRR